MTLGNRLVLERQFLPSSILGKNRNTKIITEFTKWINEDRDVQEILADMGISWPMTPADLKKGEVYDANDKKVNAGDILDVQKAGHHKVYEIAGELVFCPYGKPDLVRSYFKNDITKIDITKIE